MTLTFIDTQQLKSRSRSMNFINAEPTTINGKTTFPDPAWLVYAKQCNGVCPIDLSKVTHTKAGYRIVDIQFKPKNDLGNFVTYPYKVYIVVREKPLKMAYTTIKQNGFNE